MSKIINKYKIEELRKIAEDNNEKHIDAFKTLHKNCFFNLIKTLI